MAEDLQSPPSATAKRRIMQLLIVLAGLPILLVGLMFYRSLTSTIPKNLGVVDGRLAPAPSSPNCVLTQTNSESHRMEPITISSDESANDLMATVRTAIDECTNATIVTATDDYLHAEFVSTFFRFVDDVEFYIDLGDQKIHFRSASRIGYSDLGANRQRMQKLVQSLERQLAAKESRPPDPPQ